MSNDNDSNSGWGGKQGRNSGSGSGGGGNFIWLILTFLFRYPKILVQLILGFFTIRVSMGHLDGAEMIKFMTWAQGIFTFRTRIADVVANVDWVFKVHIVLGLTIMIIFPFTRLVHMLSAPVWYLNRRGWQLVRSKRPMPIARRTGDLSR